MRHFRILARFAAIALLLAAPPAIADTTVSGPVIFSTGLSVSAAGAVTLAVPSRPDVSASRNPPTNATTRKIQIYFAELRMVCNTGLYS